jgi:hypothetical protein
MEAWDLYPMESRLFKIPIILFQECRVYIGMSKLRRLSGEGSWMRARCELRFFLASAVIFRWGKNAQQHKILATCKDIILQSCSLESRNSVFSKELGNLSKYGEVHRCHRRSQGADWHDQSTDPQPRYRLKILLTIYTVEQAQTTQFLRWKPHAGHHCSIQRTR